MKEAIKMIKQLKIAVTIWFLFGFSPSVWAEVADVLVNPNNSSAVVQCQNPRPEICYQIYQPVCAIIKEGESKIKRLTFSNDCMACSDQRVSGFETGSCSSVLN